MDVERVSRLHGGLDRLATRLHERLRRCDLCPRLCRDDRTSDRRGTCRAGARARVASSGPHFGEEDVLVGTGGSGTVFFSGCNLRCCFCQNWDISQENEGDELEPSELAEVFLRLQRAGCHNLNLVTPTHCAPAIVAALATAAPRGFSLPVVWNSSGYESVELLRELEGVVDIYMPDLKFLDADRARRFCAAPEYPDVARAALREMARQTGPLRVDANGIATRGLLVRHLLMPGGEADTRAIIDFLAEEIGPDTWLNLMGQYRPLGLVGDRFREICRRIDEEEVRSARSYARARGLTRLDR